MLVPNAYGGSSGGMLGPDSELYKELRAKGAQVRKRGTGSYLLGREDIYFRAGLFRGIGLLLVCSGNVRDPESDEMVVIRRFCLFDIAGIGT